MTHRLAWASDIHWSFAAPAERAAFLAQLYAVNADALVITGDIGEYGTYREALREIAASFGKAVYHVLGNHDYYGAGVEAVRTREAGWKTGAAPDLHYLTLGPVAVPPGFVLCGVDGWGDMRNGDPEGTRVYLADYDYIADLRGMSQAQRIYKLRELGDADAALLRAQLDLAVKLGTKSLLVATHVPPYPGATWHNGQLSNREWQPNFSCKAVGDALARFAGEHPGVKITVLCGHTHGGGYYEHRDNLRVHTADATYHYPQVQGVFVDGTEFEPCTA
jgi:3',5'-cyclic AMP phosphodiesterase CpdA